MPENNKSRFAWYMSDGSTQRCQAFVKDRSRQCEKAAREGFKVCEFHGAGRRDSPGGRPPKHGRFSKRLPKSILAMFDEAMLDPTMLELRSEIALVTTRTEELVSTLSSNQVSLNKIVLAYETLELAFESADDPDAVATAMRSLKTCINSASSLRYTWNEILTLIQHRKSLVESERRRLLENKAMLSVDQLMLLMAQIQQVVLKEVISPEVRSRIALGLKELMTKTSVNGYSTDDSIDLEKN
jgi:hypothetical protein